ncbi:MAG: nicotinate-nucleotide adenylyltransferase [Peptococcaceae bacterium]|nr:MAG: nicotinate-nucleotide adenylyltransferase [Peptococcaceae bacterium]
MERVGIMGGTFDPVHYGHLVTAEEARYEFRLGKVIFVPAGQPPHKTTSQISDPKHRYAMTRMAITTNPYFQVSSLEMERGGISYAIDTVRQVTGLYPSAEIYFITGADAVLEILNWKNVEDLLSLCYFIAATRPGYRLDDLKENIFYMEVPALAISSSEIRQRVQEGKPIKYLLPEAVEDYINKHGLYRH